MFFGWGRGGGGGRGGAKSSSSDIQISVDLNHKSKYFLISFQDLYMSHFSYSCKTEWQNGIFRLISELCVPWTPP